MLRERFSKKLIEDENLLQKRQSTVHSSENERDNLPALSPISSMEDRQRNYRRPTTKTGRGYGKKKKTNQVFAFKLASVFKANSYDNTQAYVPEQHMEKVVLQELQLSPRQKGFHQLGRSRTSKMVGERLRNHQMRRRGSSSKRSNRRDRRHSRLSSATPSSGRRKLSPRKQLSLDAQLVKSQTVSPMQTPNGAIKSNELQGGVGKETAVTPQTKKSEMRMHIPDSSAEKQKQQAILDEPKVTGFKELEATDSTPNGEPQMRDMLVRKPSQQAQEVQKVVYDPNTLAKKHEKPLEPDPQKVEQVNLVETVVQAKGQNYRTASFAPVNYQPPMPESSKNSSEKQSEASKGDKKAQNQHRKQKSELAAAGAISMMDSNILTNKSNSRHQKTLSIEDQQNKLSRVNRETGHFGTKQTKQSDSEETAPDFEKILRGEASDQDQKSERNAEKNTFTTSLGYSKGNDHRNVASQDMRQGYALMADLEISQIKEETNSKEGTSVLTRNKSNFLGSAASPYGEDHQIQLFLHRQSQQSKVQMQSNPSLSKGSKDDDDELMNSESAPDFDIFKQHSSEAKDLNQDVYQKSEKPKSTVDVQNLQQFMAGFKNSEYQSSGEDERDNDVDQKLSKHGSKQGLSENQSSSKKQNLSSAGKQSALNAAISSGRLAEVNEPRGIYQEESHPAEPVLAAKPPTRKNVSRNRKQGLRQSSMQTSSEEWQTFGRQGQESTGEVNERSQRPRRPLKAEARALARSKGGQTSTSESQDEYGPRDRQESADFSANKLAMKALEVPEAIKEQNQELTDDRIKQVQKEFENQMREQFEGEKHEVKYEFDRRFAIYKHRTEAELRRERQIFREMRVRENQLTGMLDVRDKELEELNLHNRKLEKKLRKVEIKLKDADLQVNDLVNEIDNQKEAYRELYEQYDQFNTARLGHAISDKSIDKILKQSVSHTEFELQKENDFLHMRLQQLSKEITQIKEHRDVKQAYQEKLEFYEAAIEEVTAENTRLVLMLDSVEALENDKKQLQGKIEELQRENRAYMRDIVEFKHKLNVQQTLRSEFKDFVSKNMTVFEVKDSAIDALSQIEKHNLLNETGGFTDATMSPFDLNKSQQRFMEETNTDLTAHAHLLNQSKNFIGATNGHHQAQTSLGGTGPVAIGQMVMNDQTLIDGSFSNNLGQSFLAGSNFNSEMLPAGAKSARLNQAQRQDFSQLHQQSKPYPQQIRQMAATMRHHQTNRAGNHNDRSKGAVQHVIQPAVGTMPAPNILDLSKVRKRSRKPQHQQAVSSYNQEFNSFYQTHQAQGSHR